MESSLWTILFYTAVPDLFSHLPAELIDPIRRSLAGERFVAAPEVFRIERSLPHGHVQAGCLQPSLFDQANLAEIRPPEYPGERLVACFNPVLAEERRRKRKPLPEVEIALQVGIVLHRFVQ
jgi:hypothetical protein